MGNTSSSVYNNLKEILEENPEYFIYEYEGAYFVLIPEKDSNLIRLYISEVREITEKDRTLEKDKELYKSGDNTFISMPEEIVKNTPYLEADPFSDDIYLGYLYATKSRSGRYMEALMSQISKELGAKKIYLLDAARSGPCSRFSTSIQLFISDSKKFTTYYENLGYRNDDPTYIKMKDTLKYLYPKMTSITMDEVLDMVKKEYDTFDKEDESATANSGILTLGFILMKEGNLDLNIIEYIQYLVKEKRCSILENFMNTMTYIEDPDISTFFINLLNIRYGNYYKFLE